MRALMAQAEQLDRVFAKISNNQARQLFGSNTQNATNARNAAGRGLTGVPVGLPSKVEYDQFNQTIRTTRDFITLNRDGMEVFRTTIKSTAVDLRLVAAETTRWGEASRNARNQTRQFNQDIFNQERAIRSLQSPYHATINSAQSVADSARLRRDAARAERTLLPGAPALANATERYDINRLDREIAAQQRLIRQSTLATNVAGNQLRNDPVIQQEEGRLRYLKGLLPQYEAYEKRIQTLGDRAVTRARLAAPPLPASLETVRKESPNLFNRLAAGGLGKDEKGVFSSTQIYKQGGDNLQLTRDLERNVTQLRGQYRGLNGELINVNAAYAEGGRVIGRYGGILSGTQNFLRQTVNNFQKVVQWGLATTAVFAGIGLATTAISTVTALDKSLNQLSITAELSSKQTAAVFDDLSKIAYNTATPLQELVKAADDIALATKKANQSTSEWQANIKSLATSVGILTNITGLDTVKATDLLTSTMKQLNLQSSDLVGILNKVTAVAGGQANSITDIVSGLGAMAEAASTAGLSMDETIGVVQVLGQVTSKSASEIATSFKNLVGSVDSVGGKKALGKFDISTRDTEGNLRNILDIYEEIQAKIRTGVIPEADIKDLIRGIAGGPRRAPDASALLANVGAIRQAEEKSKKATNEALLANVKYLDTIDAKITQIGVKFQTTIQKALGPGIKAFVTDIANVLSTLLDFLSGLDAGFIKTILQVGAFVLGLKALLSIGSLLAGLFKSVYTGLTLVNQAALSGTAALLGTSTAATASAAKTGAAMNVTNAAIEKQILFYKQLQAAALAASETQVAAGNAARIATLQATLTPAGGGIAAGPLSRRQRLQGALGGYKGALPALGFGALAAGVSAGTGSNLVSSIGGGLQAAGITLLLGAPIPHAKALGAALAVIGTGLQFISGESKKAAVDTKGLKTEILSAINQYKNAQDTIANLTKDQEKLAETYKTLSGDADKSNESIGILDGTITQYASNVKELALAHKALEESLQNIPDLTAKYGHQIALAQKGVLDATKLAELQEIIYKEIFSKSNPELFIRDSKNLIKPSTISGQIESSGSSIASNISLIKGQPGATLDLANLKSAQEVFRLFSADGTKLTATFAHTADNLDAIHKVLIEASAAEGETGEKAKVRLATYEAILATLSATSQSDTIVKQQESLIAVKQLLGQISAEEGATALANLHAYQALIDLADKLPSRTNGPDNAGTIGPTNEGAQELAIKTFFNGNDVKPTKATVEEGRKIVEFYGNYKELVNNVNDLTAVQVATLAEAYGVQVQLTAEQQKQKDLSEEIHNIQQSIVDQKKGGLDTLAQSKGDAQRQFLSGDITKKQRDALFAAAEGTKALKDEMFGLFDTLAGNADVLAQFEKQLSTIPGLENLVEKNAGEAASLLGAFFDSANLSGAGAEFMTKKLLGLILALQNIPKTVVSNVIIAVKTLTGTAAQAYSNFREAETHDLNPDGSIKNSANPTTTTTDTSYIQNEINKLLKQIQSIGSGGSTLKSSLGGGGGASSGSVGAGLDVSQIDLPSELYGQNQTSLIKEAVKRARALQKTIPGASKEASNDVVSILKGTQNLLTVRGVKDDLLRRALEELAAVEKKRLEFETKADTIRRIRVGGGDFSAIANVPVNSTTGISLGGSQGPINVTLNLNGTILTAAQLAQFGDLVASSLKRQIAG